MQQVIVQCSRYHDGGGEESSSEILGVDANGNYISKDIFVGFKKEGTGTGKYIGEMVPCNYVPSFFEDIVVNKLPFQSKTLLHR